MQKNQLMPLLEHIVPSTEFIAESSKECLVKKHSDATHQSFVLLLEGPTQEIAFDDIQKKLKEIWELTQGTTLSYTALPETPVTNFLIHVAYEALRAKHRERPPSLMEVIKLLMPTLKLDEAECLLTPAEFGYGLEEAPISALEFNESAPSQERVINHFLKTHIVSDSGEYIIPLWTLNQMNKAEYSGTINNVYYEPAQAHPGSDPARLTSAECLRLLRHNPLTQSLDELITRLNGYKHDMRNLLGQLNQLSQSLYFNSVHGIGQEEQSGASAEVAIRGFFDYYNTLDREELERVIAPAPLLKLKHELMKLRHCIGVYHEDEQHISNIETCMATRRQRLQEAMQGQEAALAQIGSSQSNLSQLIEAGYRLLGMQFTALNQAIQRNEVQGHEDLPLTKRLIEWYKIDLRASTIESLSAILNGLSSSELTDLITPVYAKNWSETIGTLEQLVLLFLQLPVEKVDVLCQKLGEELKAGYLPMAKDYISLLLLLSAEKQSVVAKNLIRIKDLIGGDGYAKPLLDSLIYYSRARSHWRLFYNIFRQYPEDEQLKLLKIKVLGGRMLHFMSHNPESLKAILELLPQSKRLDALKVRDSALNTVLHCAADHSESLKVILELLPESERFDALNLRGIMSDTVFHPAALHPKSLKIILALCPEDERLRALKLTNADGKTVLHYAACHSESLRAILDLLPERQRLEALWIGDRWFTPVICEALPHSESLRAILDLLPERDRLEALRPGYTNCGTVLHSAAAHPESLKIILALYPENERLKALMITNGRGITVLDCAARNSKSLWAILELLPSGIYNQELFLTLREWALKDIRTCDTIKSLHENRLCREVLYSIEHPYRYFLYQHRGIIAQTGLAAAAACMAAYYSLSANDRAAPLLGLFGLFPPVTGEGGDSSISPAYTP